MIVDADTLFSSSGLCYGETACALFDASRMENTSALLMESLRRTTDSLELSMRCTDGIWCVGETRTAISQYIIVSDFDVHALMNVGYRVYWKGTPWIWDQPTVKHAEDMNLWINRGGSHQFWTFEEV